MSREREELQAELTGLKSVDLATNRKHELEAKAAELSRQHTLVKQMRDEREFLLRDLSAAREEADDMEAHLAAATARLDQVQDERDEFLQELEESTATMYEMRDSLDEVFASV